MRTFITDDGFRIPTNVVLPPEALEKIGRLQMLKADRQALLSAASERRREAAAAHTRQTHEARRLRREVEDGRLVRREQVRNLEMVTPDRGLAELAENGVNRLSDQMMKAEHVYAERQARFTEVAKVIAALQGWVEQLPAGTTMKSHVLLKVGSARGSIPEQVASIRDEVAGLAEERERVSSAPKHSSEVKAMARRQLLALAERGRPDLTALLHGNGQLSFTRQTETRWLNERPVTVDGDIDVSALMAWLDHDLLAARLEAEIDAQTNDEFALAAADRTARLAEIDADILSLERQEEVMIEAAEKSGQDIPRRPEASPLAILSVSIVQHGALDQQKAAA